MYSGRVYVTTTPAVVTVPVVVAAPPVYVQPAYVPTTYVHTVPTTAYVQTVPTTTYVQQRPVSTPPTVTLSGPPLPAGWTSAVDPATNKVYFMNHQTRTTTWEDPRFPSQSYAPPQQNYHQQQPPAQRPQGDTSYQYGHRFCNSCGIEVTRESTVCICGKPLRN